MTGVEPDGLRAEAQRLRSAEPSRGIRGFDEAQTRTLLEGAATLLNAAASEQEVLRRELAQLRSETTDEAAGEEAIGKALLAATRAGEEIAAEARASAERITADAERRAAAILQHAKTAVEERERESLAAREKLETELSTARSTVARERAAAQIELERERARVIAEAEERAEAIVANARDEVEKLQSHAEQLRSLLADGRRRFVELAESALRELEGVEAKTSAGNGDLLEDLRTPNGEPSASRLAAD